MKLLLELRGVRKSSPFLPSPYLFTALHGKKSTGSSIIVSTINSISGEEDNRKIIKKIFVESYLSKKQLKKYFSHPFLKSTSQFLPTTMEIFRRAKYLFGCSDELLMLDGVVQALIYKEKNETLVYSVKHWLTELLGVEKAFFQLGKIDKNLGVSSMIAYHLYPKEFITKYHSSPAISTIRKEELKELLSYNEIIKFQNLYADTIVRLELHSSTLGFIKSSTPGSYTETYWDNLLLNSIYKNWTNVRDAFAKKYQYEIDLSDLRKIRKGKHLTKRFKELASLLSSSDDSKLEYWLAYCLDWHFRQLSVSLQESISEISMQGRVDTAQKRWSDLVISIGAKLPLPSSN